ncbi:A disintegrin and metalloproteinase with thrombospondin motifs 7 [Rhynchospora pubera]|uniref:A disintegrin and metalloproteinase with thrombospondin motifs 7 n=1 Tax=Rhynchospora pubera TaxID=906938 RepID=A0AAV8HZF1_9POAL|nr:A disintegrin and metalloproteinase with thrombospondin motifs 7 [Rhynchospora pubera]KAJ4821363.1 A disintegrin and metalloproteinase with thrombospondin motifs 7 [Rhynchospora pubera]
MAARLFAFLFSFVLSFFSFSIFSSAISPSSGCYWTACQSKWLGGCGAGHVSADQSDDCNGLCAESTDPPCLPFHSHFHCCVPETPRVTNKCVQCKSKLDFGKEYICCTDCSDPTIMNKGTKLGYCKTGADFAMQLKPQETFKWVAGPWMECSSPCDGGIRYRDVACYGSMSDTSIKHYPVDDSSCSSHDMPPRQEACNTQRCSESVSTMLLDERKKATGMSGWLVAFIVLLGLTATGGIVFAGYIYYQRTYSSNGFVYIMLEGYS